MALVAGRIPAIHLAPGPSGNAATGGARPAPLAHRALAPALAVALAGCAGFEPRPLEEVPFRERQETRTAEGVTVSVAVPTADEAERIYGVRLASRNVQPVWLEVRNERDRPLWYLPPGTDPNGFVPSEAAFAFHHGRALAGEMDAHFEALAFRNPVPPGESVSGFVLVDLDEGYKAVHVDLVGRGFAQGFTFVFVDPDFRSDVSRVDLDALYTEDELVRLEDEVELRAALEALPACTTNRSGDAEGDPLNLVLIGERGEIFAALVRRGWQATEVLSLASLWRTVRAFLFESRYRYSPISPLHVYGRAQDFSAQKIRGSIHERNHARFWLTPLRFRGEEVWLGQISRDIGVKFTWRSPTISTHKIDPDVDEARRYLLEDLAYSQAVSRFAFCGGVGEARRDEPRENLVGDPWFSDGRRAVLFFEAGPRSLADLRILEWGSLDGGGEAPE